MKWTYDWLTDYLDTTATPEQIAATLTRIGLEVDDLNAPVPPIAAKIVECAPHPDSDHLHVLMVDDGTGTLRQVVCGAPNARAGILSALARPGCVVGGIEIKPGKLRGVLSNGMMCSARELGIGDDHDGIVELPANTAVGTVLVPAPAVFEASITPNRPDYLSVSGIARDLAAAGLGTYRAKSAPHLFQVKSDRAVRIETDACPTYRFCEIRGIKNGPSAASVARRLAAIGINPKNAPIDTTNYICYDMGQPMHCFDADQIHGDIIVRAARTGEEFTDLFGTSHKLTDADMVIADANGILAVAGVIGGARAMTTDATTNIILESVYFDQVAVRKTAKRMGLSTDASYRYERGIDPTITGPALATAAHMIMDACGGEIAGCGFAGRAVTPNVKIEYTPDMLQALAGIDMPATQQMEILKALDFVVMANGNTWTVYPPSARVDVQIPQHIVSELLRMHGYDQIAAAGAIRPANTLGTVARVPNLDVKEMLATRGLLETVSFGFGNAAAEELLTDKPTIKIANPITADLDTARNTLLGNILNAAAANEKRGYGDVNIFELGTVFDGDAPGDQHTQLVILRMGVTSPRHWMRRNRDMDVFDVKSDVMALMRGANVRVDASNPPRWAHPYRYGAVYTGNKKIAEFGEIHPMVRRAWKIKNRVYVAVVDDVTALPARRKRVQTPITDFQPITRDFAFVTDAARPASELVAAAVSADKRITDVTVFDAFDMGDGKKSIALTITITPHENMSDADLMAIQNAVIDRVAAKCDAQIRDK